MVKHLILILIFSYANSTGATGITADSLKNRIYNSEKSKQDAAARLKVMQGNTSQLRLLNNRSIFYTLPDGRKVRGLLLPNGKKSPAVMQNDFLVPACLTTSNILVPGVFNESLDIIQCNIPDVELALIDDRIYGAKEITKPKPEKVDTKPKKKITKYSNSSNHGAKEPANQTGGKPTPESRNPSSSSPMGNNTRSESANPFIYVPPAGGPSSSNATGFSLQQTNSFGITMGTWAEIRLDRPISSADSGSIEFILTEPVVGEYKTLEAGTIFFASKNVNVANKKLEANIIKALTPDGEEIDKLSGWVYSLDKSAGLPGRLERDREGEAKAAGIKAGLKGISTAASSASPGGSVGSSVVDSYAGDMINNEKKYAPTSPVAVIRVIPQRGLIKFSATF